MMHRNLKFSITKGQVIWCHTDLARAMPSQEKKKVSVAKEGENQIHTLADSSET